MCRAGDRIDWIAAQCQDQSGTHGGILILLKLTQQKLRVGAAIRKASDEIGCEPWIRLKMQQLPRRRGFLQFEEQRERHAPASGPSITPLFISGQGGTYKHNFLQPANDRRLLRLQFGQNA